MWAMVCVLPKSWGAGGGLARLLLAGDRALGALAGTRVGLRALTANGKAAAVADALVRADLDLAADIRGHIAAPVTLHLVGALDVVAERAALVFGAVLAAHIRADAGCPEALVVTGTANAIDRGQGVELGRAWVVERVCQ